MQKSANRPTSTKVNLIVDLVIFVAFLVASAPHFTGIAIHEWLGIAFAAMIITHLLLHWSWLVETTVRIFTTAPRQARINYLLNSVLFIDMTLVIFTGIMISRSVMPFFGLTLTPNFFWRSLHSTTADLSVLLIGLHVALHWKWVTNSVGRYMLKPAAHAMQVTFAPTLYPEGRAIMKIVGRTVIILLAALVVIGTTMVFAQHSAANTTIPAGERGDAPPNFNNAEGASTNGAAARPAFSQGRARPERGDAMNLLAGMDVVKNLAIMTLMVALVVLLPRGVQRVRQG